MRKKQDILKTIYYEPYRFGHWSGFRDLTEMNNDWLRLFMRSTEDITLQGHRGSFKTSTLALFLALHAIVKPNETVLIFRKTATDVTEILRTVKNLLTSPLFGDVVKTLYNHNLALLRATSMEITTNLMTSNKGAPQIGGVGIGNSVTGKHADIIITDDIVNVKDRVSRAERERTKLAYQELQNIKNRGGRIINTGTPWHKDDCFSLMPDAIKYDCHQSGLMTDEEIAEMKKRMTPSLFAANYELKHIASENIIFTEPVIGAEESSVFGGWMHVDSAFYGEDYTALSIMSYHDDHFYLYGKMWRKNVQDCYEYIQDAYDHFLCPKLWNEKNADKGMVARDLRNKGMRVQTYDESTNKHIKIVTYLKAIWADIIFVDGTDEEYINQICDYNEDAEHDDAPDSAACLARVMYKRARKKRYESILGLYDLEQ